MHHNAGFARQRKPAGCDVFLVEMELWGASMPTPAPWTLTEAFVGCLCPQRPPGDERRSYYHDRGRRHDWWRDCRDWSGRRGHTV